MCREWRVFIDLHAIGSEEWLCIRLSAIPVEWNGSAFGFHQPRYNAFGLEAVERGTRARDDVVRR